MSETKRSEKRRRRGALSRTSQAALAVADKQRRALEMRRDGCTLQEIADALGYASPSGVWECLDAALRAVIAEPAEELRKLECERLDVYLRALAPKIERGDVRAIETALKVSTRRCRLLGLDRPIQIEERVERKRDWHEEFSRLSLDELRLLETLIVKMETGDTDKGCVVEVSGVIGG